MFKTIKKFFAVLLIMLVLTSELEPMAQTYAATSTQSSAAKYKLGKKFIVKYGKTVKIPNELSIKYYGSRLWDSTEVSFDIEITFSDKSNAFETLVYTPAEVGKSWANVIYCGDYKIKVTNAVHEKSVTLIVTKPEKIEPSVMNGSTDEFYTTKKNEYFEEERFILYVPKGITLRQDTVIMINEIMDMLEEKTGWKFMAIPLCDKVDAYTSYGYENGNECYWNVDPEGKKIQIYVVEDLEHSGYISWASQNDFVYVYDKEWENGSLSPNTVAHELMHVLQYYNLPMESDSDTFTEGLATALAYQITEEVKDRYPEYSINYVITNDVEENPDGTPSPITKSTAQELFEHNYRLDPAENMQQRNYQIGGALNLYILEKYGADGFVKLKKKMKKMGFVAKTPNEICNDPDYTYPVIKDYSKALKSVFGKKFFSSFATWFTKNKKRMLKNWNMY